VASGYTDPWLRCTGHGLGTTPLKRVARRWPAARARRPSTGRRAIARALRVHLARNGSWSCSSPLVGFCVFPVLLARPWRLPFASVRSRGVPSLAPRPRRCCGRAACAFSPFPFGVAVVARRARPPAPPSASGWSRGVRSLSLPPRRLGVRAARARQPPPTTVGAGAAAMSQTPPAPPGQVWCKICHIFFGLNNLDGHISGKAHARSKRFAEFEEHRRANVAAAAPVPRWFCVICRKGNDAAIRFLAHSAGKSHRRTAAVVPSVAAARGDAPSAVATSRTTIPAGQRVLPVAPAPTADEGTVGVAAHVSADGGASGRRSVMTRCGRACPHGPSLCLYAASAR